MNSGRSTGNRPSSSSTPTARRSRFAVRGNFYGQVVHGEELPPYVGQAFIAAEDQRFMEHGGVDFQSLARAAFANLTAGTTVQGGSALTQQLVKNLLVGSDQNLRRKAQEARLAMTMENELTKAQIFDLYLNRVYLGANVYGVQAAAQTYFDKPATELTLAESAFLGALPKAPSRYASDKTGVFVDPASQESISGYVLDIAMHETRKAVPDLPPDAVITLSVDGTLQRRAEVALKSALAVRKLGASQDAIVMMDRHGPIRLLVGAADSRSRNSTGHAGAASARLRFQDLRLCLGDRAWPVVNGCPRGCARHAATGRLAIMTKPAAEISGWQIAGKTGTSQNWRDAWFVGYSSRLVSGI